MVTLESSIVQIDTIGRFVLISTTTRSILVDTEIGQFAQIGKKLRNGNFGACFYNPINNIAGIPAVNTERSFLGLNLEEEEENISEDARIFCSRPGCRIWEANFDPNVLITHQFKYSLTQFPTRIIEMQADIDHRLNLIETLEVDYNAPDNINFEKLQIINDKFILTYNNDGVYILDTSNVSVVFWTNKFTNIKSVKTHKNDIFVYYGHEKITVITMHELEQIILDTLFNKRYYVCMELCQYFMTDILNMIEKSERLRLLLYLKQKFDDGNEILRGLKPMFSRIDELNAIELSASNVGFFSGENNATGQIVRVDNFLNHSSNMTNNTELPYSNINIKKRNDADTNNKQNNVANTSNTDINKSNDTETNNIIINNSNETDTSKIIVKQSNAANTSNINVKRSIVANTNNINFKQSSETNTSNTNVIKQSNETDTSNINMKQNIQTITSNINIEQANETNTNNIINKHDSETNINCTEENNSNININNTSDDSNSNMTNNSEQIVKNITEISDIENINMKNAKDLLNIKSDKQFYSNLVVKSGNEQTQSNICNSNTENACNLLENMDNAKKILHDIALSQNVEKCNTKSISNDSINDRTNYINNSSKNIFVERDTKQIVDNNTNMTEIDVLSTETEYLCFDNDQINTYETIYKSYQLCKGATNVNIKQLNQYFAGISTTDAFKIGLGFKNFVKESQDDEKTAYFWYIKQYLSYFLANTNYKLYMQNLDVKNPIFCLLLNAYDVCNGIDMSTVCKCGHPLPKSSKLSPIFVELGREILRVYTKTDNPLVFLNKHPFYYGYFLKENFVNSVSNAELLHILVHYSSLDLLKFFGLNFSWDDWDSYLKMHVKYRKRTCLNCDSVFKAEKADFLSWNDIATAIFEFLNGQNALKLLLQYSKDIPNGELNVEFFQACIFAETFSIKEDKSAKKCTNFIKDARGNPTASSKVIIFLFVC